MLENLNQLTILIIDDEQEIAALLKTVLTREGFVNVYTAATAKEGLALFNRVMPDLVLLDIMLPDGNGYDLFTTLQGIKAIPILFISAKDEEVDRLLGFAIGADDYITKPFSAKEVVYRVKARLKARSSVPDKQTESAEEKRIEFGDVSIDLLAREVRKAGEVKEFTAKEYKILLVLVQNPGRVLSKEVICQSVWGDNYIGIDNTIAVHIRKIRLKIEQDPSHPQWIQTVIGLGYKFILKRG